MHTLQACLLKYDIQPETILFLINQGIEIEKLKLELQRFTNSESIESHIKILQGERFTSLLIASTAVG